MLTLLKTLITSCNRYDLLSKTMHSLTTNQSYHLDFTIHEDHPNLFKIPYEMGGIHADFPQAMIQFTRGAGQHGSIERYLKHLKDKYYLHCEDDWEFSNHYDWISSSILLMDVDPMIIKVLARDTSPHPCEHDQSFHHLKYGYLKPWMSDDYIMWCGFSWNPGVTRVDLLKEFMPFPKWEQDLAEQIYKKGYKVVELADKVYKHIGDGRSTH